MNDNLEFLANISQVISLLIATIALVLQVVDKLTPETKNLLGPWFKKLRPFLPYVIIAALFFFIGSWFSKTSTGTSQVGVTKIVTVLSTNSAQTSQIPLGTPIKETQIVTVPVTQIVTSPPIVITATPLPLPTLTPTTSPSILFFDNFDLRAKDDWEPLAGDWLVVDGQYTTARNSGRPITFVGDYSWTNYAVDLDVNPECEPTRFIVRQQPAQYIAMEVVYSRTRGLLVSGQGEQLLAEGDNGFGDRSRNYHIRIEVQDDIYRINVDGLQVLQFQNATLPSGRVGISYRIYGTCSTAFFDNFKVTQLP